ncbi:MAG: GldG family protein [Planctomycetes bacterium]|nr:GldG family protein [Planctomycetota bacterium]
MSAAQRRLLFATALVGLLAVAFGTRVLDALRLPRVDLEHTGWVRLDPRAERAMHDLDSEVVATLVLSAPAEFPSSERGLDRELHELLERLTVAGRGRFVWQELDPARSPDLADWIAGQGVTPFSVREVRADAFAERSVYAGLVLSYGAHGKTVINGISRERLDQLELLIAEELHELVSPSRPKIALASNAPTTALAAELARTADVVSVDLERGEPLPSGTALVVWIAPRTASDAAVAELARAIDGGTSVVLAGGGLEADGTNAPSHAALAAIAAQFGVRVADEVVADDSGISKSAAAAAKSELAVASIASEQDFRLLGSQPNGTLCFRAPNPLELDAAKLVERGLESRVVSASGERAFRRGTAASGADPRRGSQALALQLAPKDGWGGSLLVFGSSSPFEDGWFELADFAHRNLARALVASLADAQRSARVRARGHGVEPLPTLSADRRLAWRVAVIGLLPTCLFLFAVLRGRIAALRLAAGGSGRDLGFVALLLGLFAVAGFAASRLLAPVGVDVTVERLHTLAPRSLVAAKSAVRAVKVELLASSTLPPRIAATVARVRVLVADLEQAGANLEFVRRLPDALSDDERSELAREGIAARAVETRDETAVTVRAVWAALRVSTSDRSVAVDLTSADGDAIAEFRLVGALEEALGRRRPCVAFAADTPRLSAAEARELYEAKKLFAPTESDVYSQAEAWLVENGFDVVRIDPAAPRLPQTVDAIVWLQPRRDATPMLATVAAALARGTGVVIAAQHFTIQSRRLDTERGELAHWPRPQYCDIENGFLADLGLVLAREVLCDASSATLDVATEVGARRAARELSFETSARPFVLRALPEDFSTTSPITRGLSDLRLPYANRFRVDAEKVAAHGLRVEPLVRSTAKAWTIDWKGGDLAAESLAVPAETLGPVDLALDVRGRFPRADGTPSEHEARAVLIGCSETFKNGQLFDQEWRAADFLLAATTAAALGDEHAGILAQRPRRAGFRAPPTDQRLAWRGVVVLAGPALVLAFAFAMRRLAARPLAGVGP